MGQKTLRNIAVATLQVNAVFWLVMAIASLALSSDPSDPLVLVMTGVMFSEAVFYAVCAFGIERNNAVLYAFALILSGGNAILSVTDQFGVLDVVSLVLSLGAFLVVYAARSRSRSVSVTRPSSAPDTRN